jgi:hypothetical protein
MRGPVDRIAAFVEDLIHNRRPCRFKASAEEMAALRAAAELCSARPGANRPDRRFIENVYAYISLNTGRMLR